ncbi:MAG: helix-hairpin-helix domain-containing protein [Chitinophagaceae bacterium]|nr:helix-hairpin-helix domain-containing protein [Chitinophagaceae bacterium]
MPTRKKFLPEYLSFTRKERIGIIAVAVTAVVSTTIPTLYAFFHKPQPVDHTAFEKEIAALNVQEPDSGFAYPKRSYNDGNYRHYQSSEKNYYDKQTRGELFYFDPNTLSVDGWKKLGVREKTANTIQNYISKGGRFYKPEDISKIWGLRENEVNRLLPYVKIEAKPTMDYNKYPDQGKAKIYEKPTYTITPCDVNSSDTAAFIALPGIGSKLAARIVAFREKLGGFYKIDQLAETYGLPDSVFQKIKGRLVIGNSSVKKLNINTATVDELKTHPYLRYNIANAVVQYRLQHGSFSTVSDIKKIMMITEEIYNKAAPYLIAK